MPEQFLKLPDDERRLLLSAAAQELQRTAQALEKDVWVCWALEQLWTTPSRVKMAFKGGTSLSKIYRAIERFSEDVDVTLDYRSLDESFDPYAAGTSNSKLKQASERLRELVKEHVEGFVIPHLRAQLAQLVKDESYTVEATDQGEKVWIRYRSVTGGSDSYIADNVLIEFGGRNITEPNEKHVVVPDMAQMIQDLSFQSASVDVLAGARTFWEKATLIHVECHRDKIKGDANRMSRHWYDMHRLADHRVGRAAVADRALLADVVKHKKVFFNTSYANYDACMAKGLRLVPTDDSALRMDFQKMVGAGMFFGTVPTFDEIVGRLRLLEAEINGGGAD